MLEIRLIAYGSLVSCAIAMFAAPPNVDRNHPNDSLITEPSEDVRYDGAQVWRIDIADEKTKEIVFRLQQECDDIEIWRAANSKVDIFLKKSAIEGRASAALRAAHISHTVVVSNMQDELGRELQTSRSLTPIHNGTGHYMTWDAYHCALDMCGLMLYLTTKYPHICKMLTIGYSTEGRELQVIRISNGNPKNKAIWIDGGTHAREWVSPAAVTYILNNLVEKWDDQPDYIKNINWHFQPLVNPDGYEYSIKTDRLWRKNRRNNGPSGCYGVDLNRNYGFSHGVSGATCDPCSEIYRGQWAFSEPETKAHECYFNHTKEKFKAYLTFHSFGQYILYPWGYAAVVPPDDEDLKSVGKLAADRMKEIDNQEFTVGPAAIALYPAAGTALDYAKSLGIKYAYAVELRDIGYAGFLLPPSEILYAAKEAEIFVKTVAEAVDKLTN